MRKYRKGKSESEKDSSASNADLLMRTRVSFLITSSLVITFAVSYGYLEYYHINDSIQGKIANLTVKIKNLFKK